LASTVNLGTYTGTTTNSATSLPANDELYNYPRLSAGGLITPFNVTALPATPANISILVDELYWAQTGANQTLVTNIYNAMPVRLNKVWLADFFIGSNANLPMPIISTSNTQSTVALIANANIVNPSVTADYESNIYATPLTASALFVMPTVVGDNVTNINISANFMFASAIIVEAVIAVGLGGGPMIAHVQSINQLNPYLDDYRIIILTQTWNQGYDSSFYGGYGIGDIDS
jgi:hypothetical protein